MNMYCYLLCIVFINYFVHQCHLRIFITYNIYNTFHQLLTEEVETTQNA